MCYKVYIYFYIYIYICVYVWIYSIYMCIYVNIYIQYLYISEHIFKFIGITSHCAFSTVYRGQGTIDVAESVEGT
jgi:hypothetical protein